MNFKLTSTEVGASCCLVEVTSAAICLNDLGHIEVLLKLMCRDPVLRLLRALHMALHEVCEMQPESGGEASSSANAGNRSSS